MAPEAIHNAFYVANDKGLKNEQIISHEANTKNQPADHINADKANLS